ncbi:hypothetical protein NBRC3280_3368 [Acetobacter pasteurianus NBRC 3280]|uniref:Uncharacterized protein n=1 Tax=Acetobacter pasteurianus NBRC 3278 TaxID=1226660 RepID=A0A401X996_ACEPA|nr:hypothetical protein NBRC3277_3373 [Acetobacter pasteurianus NBRC 3277]GCD64404.1 hypothetical protein NBRC3278_3497 [Acetobacter pasteurianus NBRC 3278]GCD70733.1 hypothetical protein NBRC3280_3368 [Acetobacter pasteurianus NBRC 3280]
MVCHRLHWLSTHATSGHFSKRVRNKAMWSTGGATRCWDGLGVISTGSAGISCASSPEIRPRRTSGKASRSAKPRARICNMRRVYCCHGPCLPKRFARLASAILKSPVTSSPSIRLATHTARRLLPSPSKYSLTDAHLPDPRTSASMASPQTLGRPLITAMFWIACMGARPSSEPICTAIMMFSGLPL